MFSSGYFFISMDIYLEDYCGDETYDPDYDMINTVRSQGVVVYAYGQGINAYIDQLHEGNLTGSNVNKEVYTAGYEAVPAFVFMGSMGSALVGGLGLTAGGITGAAGLGGIPSGAVVLSGGSLMVTVPVSVGVPAGTVGNVVLAGTGVAGMYLFAPDGNGDGANRQVPDGDSEYNTKHEKGNYN